LIKKQKNYTRIELKTIKNKKQMSILKTKPTTSRFAQRINRTLGVFETAKNELIQLNNEIATVKQSNLDKIAILTLENQEHETYLKSNANVISNINLFLNK